MKKRIVALFLVVLMGICGIYSPQMEVHAEEMGEDLDFSYLLTDDALVGSMQSQTWGVYLAEGNSIINKISSTKIGAGGNTVAAVKCQVAVTSIVERLSSGSWVRVTSWNSTVASGYVATVSKSLTVGTGYYYRVRSSHYAASDGSSSCTNALSM